MNATCGVKPRKAWKASRGVCAGDRAERQCCRVRRHAPFLIADAAGPSPAQLGPSDIQSGTNHPANGRQPGQGPAKRGARDKLGAKCLWEEPPLPVPVTSPQDPRGGDPCVGHPGDSPSARCVLGPAPGPGNSSARAGQRPRAAALGSRGHWGTWEQWSACGCVFPAGAGSEETCRDGVLSLP